MATNKNWNRWIFASISRHFTDELTGTAPLFIEGQFRDLATTTDFFELRIDGPKFQEASKDCYIFDVDVNILIQSAQNDTNYHTIHQNVGIVASAFKDIKVLRKGTIDVEDDDTFLGCLQLRQNRRTRDLVDITHFGQVDKNKNLMQSTVEGHYKLILQV